jgi:hypothetical protein
LTDTLPVQYMRNCSFPELNCTCAVFTRFNFYNFVLSVVYP